MADKDSIVVEDLPSTNFMLNPYFYKLLNYREDKTKTRTFEDYNKVLEYTDVPHCYELHLITDIDTTVDEGEESKSIEEIMFDENTGKLTDKVTLLIDSEEKPVKADVYLQTFITEYGFNVVENDIVDVLNIGDDDVTIYGWVILDQVNEFVLLYGLYNEALDVCGELFLDEGNTMQINIDTSCSEMIQ